MTHSDPIDIDAVRASRISAVRENIDHMETVVQELLEENRYDDAKAVAYGQALAGGMLLELERGR